MSKRKLSNLFKRKILSGLPKVKIAFRKSGFSRWAGGQIRVLERLRQPMVTDYLS